jgi:hypothetical protein
VTLAATLERSQLPRRLLGAVLAVLVPGAGHIVLGYRRLGWAVAAATLVVGAGFVFSVLGCAMTLVGVFGGGYILGTIASVLSIFALPPGPRLKEGLRALWPVLVLFLVFRGAAYGVGTWAITGEFAPDDAMLPSIVRGDLLLVAVRDTPRVGDVVLLEQSGSDQRTLRRLVAVKDDQLVITARLSDSAEHVPRTALRGRVLFVFAAARGTNGVDRVWKPLGSAR